MPGTRRLVTDVSSVWRTADRRAAARWSVGLVRRVPEILKTRNLVPADRALFGQEVGFRTVAACMRVPGRYFSAAREMYCRGVYWPTAEFLPTPGSIVMDLGANLGLYSLHAACAGAMVIAVEAQTGFAPEFRALCAMNSVEPPVILLNAMVGGRSGVFADEATRREASHWGDEPANMAVDELFCKAGVSEVDLMKIDIEGSEYAILVGEPGWLKHVKRIVMEVHGDHGDPESVVDILSDAGFLCNRRTSDMVKVSRLVDTGYIYATRRLA